MGTFTTITCAPPHSSISTLNAPHAIMAAMPSSNTSATASASSSSSPPDLIVLEGPKNVAAWEAQLAAIASGLNATDFLISSPDQPLASCISSPASPCRGKPQSSHVDNLIARYKQDSAESALSNAIAKTVHPSIFVWMLALGYSPAASLPVSLQYAFARIATQRVCDPATPKMRAEDVKLFQTLVERMEGRERETIKDACVTFEYFHMLEAYASKILRNRVTNGDKETERWFLDRGQKIPPPDSDEGMGDLHADRREFVTKASPATKAAGQDDRGRGTGGSRDANARDREVNESLSYSRGPKRPRSPDSSEAGRDGGRNNRH